MIRVQVYLDEEQDRWLEERARALGTSKAALVREGIRALRAQEVPLDEEPLLKLIGDIDDPSGPIDGSINHDKYLVEWEMERNRRGFEEYQRERERRQQSE